MVTTDIAISLPGQVGGAVKHMPGVNVQTDGPTHFATNGMADIVLIPFAKKEAVTTDSKRYGEDIELTNFSGDKALSKSVNGRAKVFTEQQVPMGTSAFLFYSRSGASTANLFEKGKLNGALTGDPSTYSFSLQPICANVGDVQAVAVLFQNYLNSVANAVDTLYDGAAWKSITNVQNQGYYDMFTAYSGLTTLSTYGVERMMTDLYHSLDVNIDSLAKAIREAIVNPTYATLVNDTVVLVASMQNFPQKFNIPVGSVSVTYDAGAFGSNAAQSYGDLDPAALDRYVYPAELWYYANTQIKTSNSSKETAYTSAESWKAILAQYENANATVNTKTKSIALIDTIQYAVARLDVKVKTVDGTTLSDNNPVEGLRAITNPSGGYPLKAVLIGNQRNVGFNFEPLTTGNVYTIYDTVMTTNIAALPDASTYSSANSTLVLETAEDDGAEGSDVYVALEFINTATDFYGIDQQLIPAGARFYLVGKLAAASATETGTKVFKQDFTTTARFNIKDLKKAYSTIPDLKAPQLEIGMSVDLSWQAGHVYDIEIGD